MNKIFAGALISASWFCASLFLPSVAEAQASHLAVNAPQSPVNFTGPRPTVQFLPLDFVWSFVFASNAGSR
jgi:hypothetical protein